MNKLNQKGVQIFAKNGQIQLNGITIDTVDISKVKTTEIDTFLADLSFNKVTSNDISTFRGLLKSSSINISNHSELATFAIFAAKLLGNFKYEIKENIITAVATLIREIGHPFLNEFRKALPENEMHYKILQVVFQYFTEKAKEMEDQYQQWIKNKSQKDYIPLFDYASPKRIERATEFIEKAVMACFNLKFMKRNAIEELVGCFTNWALKNYSDYEDKLETKENRIKHSGQEHFKPTKIACRVCGGYYFSN